MAYEFTAGESVAESFGRTSREQLDRAMRALSEELAADPIAAIHTARKAIKKERALLRMTRGSLRRRQRRRANARLRNAARTLSGVRDAEVMIQTLDALAERFAGQLPKITFEAARKQLERERHSDAAGAQRALVDAALQDLHVVRRAAEDWTLKTDDWSAIEPGVVRTYRDGRKAFRQAQKKPRLEARHTWRKRAKDGWYELRLLAPVCGSEVREQAKEAEQLAELLGTEHDLGVLREKLTRMAPEVAADIDALNGLVDGRRDQLQIQAASIGERLYAEKPAAFARRLRLRWNAARMEYATANLTADPLMTAATASASER